MVMGLGMLLIAACAPVPSFPAVPTQVLVPSTDTPVPSPTPEASPEPSLTVVEPAIPESEVAEGDQARVLAGLVLADLAGRLPADPEGIEVRAIESIVWSGESCDPALEAAQDARPGFRIVLEYAERLYVYHADESGTYLACESDVAPVEGEPVILDTSLGAVVDLAQRNLAARLDLPVSRVFVVEAASALWTDANLGCGSDDVATLAVPVAGYRIVLRVGTTEYTYHANYRQVVLCRETLLAPDATRPAAEEVTAVPQ